MVTQNHVGVYLICYKKKHALKNMDVRVTKQEILSNPNDYEGGELQLLTSGQPTTIDKKRGLITVFPAWTLHQVTPVVKGTRQTLVAWVSGEPFK
jgi:predicted 2-oxoglutarate/Fe(II)-dependent dioxygenase YbiX